MFRPNMTDGNCSLANSTIGDEAGCVLEEELDENDFLSKLFYMDILIWTCLTLRLAFGNPLLLGIIHYEWFGGDPQKRSLSNRFASNAALAMVFMNTIHAPLTVLVRFGIGNALFHMVAVKICLMFVVAAIWFVNVNTALRYVQVVIWQRVKEINEEVVIRAITRMIYCMSSCLMFCSNISRDHYTKVFLYMKRMDRQSMTHCQEPFDPLEIR